MVPPAPAAAPSRSRERYAIDFDLQEFLATRKIRKTAIARVLGVTSQSVQDWSTGKRWPLSAYKALIEHFAPDEANKYELRCTIEERRISHTVTKEAAVLAAAYDSRRGGAKIALRSGDGYYQVPVRDALPAPATILALVAPTSPQPVADEDLVAQQEVLIDLLARVSYERNDQAVHLARAAQQLKERDALLAAKDLQIAGLQRSIKEWEQLTAAERGPTYNGREIADAVVARVSDLLKTKGVPQLAVELERLSPHRGHRH